MTEILKNSNNKDKKEIIKEVILKLHDGLTVEEARKKIEEEIGSISSTDIAEVEQSLINEGVSVDIIKKFCNVHALLFESSLNKILTQEESENHPIYLFKKENREIEKITKSIRNLISNKDSYNLDIFLEKLEELISKLKEIELHYTRKEQLLFPYLEKYNFAGPTKVMWGKHNEIRDLIKNSILKIQKIKEENQIDSLIKEYINPLIEEVEGMIFKEENILYPTAKEKLSIDDWVEILKESEEVGYSFIDKPKETSALINELKKAAMGELKINENNELILPTGVLKFNELVGMLNNLPIEITFIDKNDSVRYFSDKKDRLFVRTKSVIGRKVQNCHPPQSVDAVEKILSAFK